MSVHGHADVEGEAMLNEAVNINDSKQAAGSFSCQF
jgi:hypothetical protein